jgi:hypothetical protein
VNKRTFVRGFAALTLGSTLVFSACREDALVVGNPNQPDVSLAFRDAINVEVVISKLFQQMFNGQYAASDAIWPQTLVMAFESSSQLGNFGMGTRSIIPRPLIDNSIGNAVAAGNYRDFNHLTRNMRQGANAIRALDQFISQQAGTGSQARDAKARSFGYFALGYALGHLSLIYDQAAIITPEVTDSVPPFSPYTQVNAAAIRMLDSALVIANSAAATTGSGGWPIPNGWFLQSGTAAAGPDRATWIRILRSYRAKFRAGVGRTPAERAQANWTAIRDDAVNGIITDVTIQADPVAGWFQQIMQQLAISASWSQQTPFYIGMADTAGVYTAWLQQPVLSRNWATAGGGAPLRTPDLRWPSGETRAQQQVASGGSTRTGPPSGTIMYLRNRPTGEDASNFTWGVWQYDHHRFWGIRATGGTGTWVLMARAESDMLAAEAHMRLGNTAAAVPLINMYRMEAGLPPIPATNDHNTTVPGGNACVPRVPVPAPAVTTVCGNVWEAMKYEKRMETQFTGHSQFFIDARGWGDLFADTPLHWPVPYQELFARELDTYSTTARAAVNANPMGSFAGTYGFGGNLPAY